MNKQHIQTAIKAAREKGGKRNFTQSFDLSITLKDLDLKNPAHKVKEEVVLPNGRGKPVKVGAIAEGILAENAKKAGLTVISKDQLSELAKDKPKAKKIINNVDFFISSPDLMVEVGKTLGAMLGPRNKMPKPVPPNADLTGFLNRLNSLALIRVRDQPVVHCLVGTEEMTDNEVVGNVEAVITAFSRKLPKGESNFRSVHIKLSMGGSARVGESK